MQQSRLKSCITAYGRHPIQLYTSMLIKRMQVKTHYSCAFLMCLFYGSKEIVLVVGRHCVRGFLEIKDMKGTCFEVVATEILPAGSSRLT